REAIVVTEIPYQVNKAKMIERIAEVVQDKVIEGISDLRDESDRDGVRVVIELKRDAMPEIVLNQLYRYSPLQTTFGVNMLALNGGRPELMNIKQVIAAFIAFREEVITRRTRFELRKAQERAHILVGLAIAVANIDEVIALIRAAPDPATAREDLIEREDMVVTVTHGGYVKRVPLSSYRAQRRGGKGRAAMSTRDEDFVSRLFIADTHTPMLCFSSTGMVYKLKVYRLPLGTPQSRGKAWVNLL